jgi:hypothetical protein
MSILDRVFENTSYSEEIEPSYGGFISFNSSRGTSLNFAGYFWQQNGERALQGTKQPAKTKILSLSVDYALLF